MASMHKREAALKMFALAKSEVSRLLVRPSER
jgi:hypothetical protein